MLVSLAVAGTSGGSTSVATQVYDMNGYDGILFIAFNSTIPSTGMTLWAEMGTSSGLSSTSSTIAGSGTVSTGGADTALMVDVYNPQARYVKGVIEEQSSGTVGGCIAIQYAGRVAPIPTSSGVSKIIDRALVVGASSGTV